MKPDGFFLQTPKKAFDQAILVGRWRNGFLLKVIIPSDFDETLGTKEQTVITAKDKSILIIADLLAGSQDIFQGGYGDLSDPSLGTTPACDFWRITIDEGCQVTPTVSTAKDGCVVNRPALVWPEHS